MNVNRIATIIVTLLYLFSTFVVLYIDFNFDYFVIITSLYVIELAFMYSFMGKDYESDEFAERLKFFNYKFKRMMGEVPNKITVCSYCGTNIDPRWKTCPYCGKKQ